MSDINGNSGDNFLSAGDGGSQRVFGLAGNDTLVAGAGNNQQLYGGDGADSLQAGSGGNQQLHGDSGNDTLGAVDPAWGSGFYGGGGTDLLVLDLSGLTVGTSFSQSNGYFHSNSNSNERIYVSGFEAYHFTGGAGDDYFYSLAAGDSTLIGNGGDDNLTGGSGNESLSGGAGNDYLVGGARDTLDGGAGVDQAYLDYSNQTAAVGLVYGGAAGTTYSITVNGAASGSLKDFERLTIISGSGNDTLGAVDPAWGSAGFYGGGGTDLLVLDLSGLTVGTSFSQSNGYCPASAPMGPNWRFE